MNKAVLCASVVVFFLAVTGCGPTATVKQVAVHQPVSPKNRQTKPIMFKKIISVIPRGKTVGEMLGGGFCSYKGPLGWKSEKTSFSEAELGDILRDQLQKYGYTVVGEPDSLFDDKPADKAEFLIAGRIKDVDASVCYPRSRSEDWITAKGDLFMEVEWELFSKKRRDVVFKLTTQGSSAGNGRIESFQRIFAGAFQGAVQNLLANKSFYQMVAPEAQPQERSVAEPKVEEIRVDYKTTTDPIEKGNANREKTIGTMRSSVVTVFTSGGHGSGFLISRDGYVLTNEHVVGQSRFVNVKFVTGREVNGQVVRVNRGMDVALVKLEKDFYPYLVLGDADSANIGDEVFTIGTPLSEDLSQTVTRGIISSFRVKNEIRYVQSDVGIQPGNSGGPLVSLTKGVIGICVSGITHGNYAMGLNYFIPVDEVIKALNIVRPIS